MARIVIHNPGTGPMYVGNHTVPPGDSRDFDEADVPPHLRPQPEGEMLPTVDPINDLVGSPIKEILPQLKALAAHDLDLLEEAERTGPARKGLMSAITEEKLRRATVAQELAELEGLMPGMTVAELQTHRETVAEHPELVGAIDEMIAIKTQPTGDGP